MITRGPLSGEAPHSITFTVPKPRGGGGAYSHARTCSDWRGRGERSPVLARCCCLGLMLKKKPKNKKTTTKKKILCGLGRQWGVTSQKPSVHVTRCSAILTCRQIGDWLHCYAYCAHSENLKKCDEIILEHNFKVAALSGLETLALCFKSFLWKEFLTKLWGNEFVFIINFLSSSCQGCLYSTTFSVSPCLRFCPPPPLFFFCIYQQNFVISPNTPYLCHVSR